MKIALRPTLFCCLIGAALLQPLAAQPTSLDPGFGDGGVLEIVHTNAVIQTTWDIVELSDGYYLGLGSKVVAGFDSQPTLVKYDICGVPDSTFGLNGVSTIIPPGGERLLPVSAQELPDGKILCAGASNSGGAVSTWRPTLFRIMQNGALDLSYGSNGLQLVQPGGISSGNFGNLIKIPGDTLIGVIGRFGNVNGGTLGVGLMRTLPDGTPDEAFGPGGALVYSFPDIGYSFAEWEQVHQANDSTYFVTRAESVDGGITFRPVIYAFDTSGTVRTDFGLNGRLQDPTAMLVGTGREIKSTMDAQGRLLIAVRKLLVIDGSAGFEMGFMRYLPDGTVDSSFGENGYTSQVTNIPASANMWPSTLAVNADGTIRSTFVFGLGTGSATTAMIQIDPDGIVLPGSLMEINQANTAITALIQIDEHRWLAQAYGAGVQTHQSQLRFSDNPIALPTIELSGASLTANGSGPDYQWFLEGEAINGATQAVHIPAANGSYTVAMTDELGCLHNSNVFEFTTLSSDQRQNGSLHLINNPAQHQLMLRNDLEVINYEILNIKGQRMDSGQLSHGINVLEVSGLAKGMYLLRTVGAGSASAQKFVKN